MRNGRFIARRHGITTELPERELPLLDIGHTFQHPPVTGLLLGGVQIKHNHRGSLFRKSQKGS